MGRANRGGIVFGGRRVVAVGAVLFMVALGGFFVVAGPAAASCAGTPSVLASTARNEPVFVGVVVSTTNRDRWATFAVEEVWSGDVSDTQVVIAGPQPRGGGQFEENSEQRTYQLSYRYLVFARTESAMFQLKPGEVADDDCTLTTEWTDDLAAQRPATARVVARTEPIQIQASAMTDPDKGGSNTGLLIAVVAIVVILGLGLWLVLRRGSISHRADVDVPLPDDPGEPTDETNLDPDSTP